MPHHIGHFDPVQRGKACGCCVKADVCFEGKRRWSGCEWCARAGFFRRGKPLCLPCLPCDKGGIQNLFAGFASLREIFYFR